MSRQVRSSNTHRSLVTSFFTAALLSLWFGNATAQTTTQSSTSIGSVREKILGGGGWGHLLNNDPTAMWFRRGVMALTSLA